MEEAEVIRDRSRRRRADSLRSLAGMLSGLLLVARGGSRSHAFLSLGSHVRRGGWRPRSTTTTVLSRTAIHRMKVGDMRAELSQRRGTDMYYGVGLHQIRRPALLAMLLEDLNVSMQDEDESIEPGDTDLPDDFGDADSAVSSDTELPYPEHLDLDDSYTLRMKGVSHRTAGATGIGVLLSRKDEKGKEHVVWRGCRYYETRRRRTLFEAEYTALVVALRFAVEALQLRHVELHISDDVVRNQIVGLFPVQKESLRPLYEQAMQLIQTSSNDVHIPSVVVAPKVSDNEGSTTTAWARQALKTRRSTLRDPSHPKSATILGDDPMSSANMKQSSPPPRVVEEEYDEDDNNTTATAPSTMRDKNQGVSSSNFDDTTVDTTQMHILRFDGGSRGNPGLAGAGMVLYDTRKREVWSGYAFLGTHLSNNQAEYSAVHMGLHCARRLGISHVQCEGDSNLIVQQLLGQYKVKNAGLRELFDQTRAVMAQFDSCELAHIYREENGRADELANMAMDSKETSFNEAEMMKYSK